MRSRRILLSAAAALVILASATPVLADPPAATDLGAPTRAALVSTQFNLNPQSIRWFTLTVPEVSASSGLFLDIDTEGTQMFPNDPYLALYDSTGNLVALNDDGGTGALSALSFGISSPSRPGYDGGITNGQNGPLAAGTYYLAVFGFNGFNTIGTTNWSINTVSQANGFVQLHIRLGPPAPVADAGPDQTVAERTAFTLDASASRGVDNCSVQLAWTQIAGPAVTLAVGDPFHPTAIAPDVAEGGATMTFQLEATSCIGPTIVDFVNVTITNVNRPPVAEAGPDQTVSEESTVVLDGSASYDVDDDALTFSWVQTGGPAVVLSDAASPAPVFTAPLIGQTGATLTFALTVNDGAASATDSVDVRVENVNHPPVADAGSGGTFNQGAVVTLDGSGSSDPDGDTLTFAWLQTGGPAVTLAGALTATPSFTAPTVGEAGATLSFAVTVSDGLESRSAEVSVFIRNPLSPPDVSQARPSVASLWPPNHKLVPISILGVTAPGSGEIALTIVGVTQDEPINGTGDGDTGPDAVVQGGGGGVLLRSERAGGGNGRVYRITFQATSPGGTATGSVLVSVPRNQSNGGAAVDDGENYSSVGP